MFLDIKDLVVEYVNKTRRVKAVDLVSFSLERGQALGIVGESGSGKSTLANAILRLLPEAAKVTGSVQFLDQELLTMPMEAFDGLRWKHLSVVFQKALNALSPIHRIGRQIEDIYLIHEPKVKREEIKAKALKLFSLVNLRADVYKNYPHELSGGMLQRVAIALALLHTPELVILDEATTALDVVTQGQILREIQKLEEKIDMTRIMITHDMSVVATVCDEVLVMYAGRLMEMGPVEAVIKHPGHPYTKGLIAAYPKLKAPKEALKVIKGSLPDLSEPIEGCVFAKRCPYAKPLCFELRPKQITYAGGRQVACHLQEEQSSPGQRLKDLKEA